MERLNYKKRLDIILGYLYFQKMEGNTGYFPLSELLKGMEYPASKEELTEIAKYLEIKDYIKAIYQIDEVYVQIITQGIVHVEEDLIDKNQINEDSIKEIIKKVKQNAQKEGEIESPNKAQITNRRKHIFKTLTKIKQKIRPTHSPETYDMKKDIDVLRTELEKINPDIDVIRQKMRKLEYTNQNIMDEVTYLYNNLNLYH